MALAMTRRAHAWAEGKYLCITDYAATITSDDPPFVGRAEIDQGRGFGRFFVTVLAHSRLSAADQQSFRAAIDGTGFVVDSQTYVAKFEHGVSIDGVHDMAFGHRGWMDKDSDAPHIYRSRFGGVFWLTHDNGFTAFAHSADGNDVLLRGRCELVAPP